MTRKRLVAAAIGLAIVAVVVVLALRLSASRTTAAYAPFGEPGTRTLYRVRWQTDATASVESATAEALSTKIDIEGDLQIDVYAHRDDGVVIGIAWARLDRAVGEALGQPLSDLPAQLPRSETVAVLDARGQVKELGFSSATTPLARLVQRALVLELAAEIAAGPGGIDVVDTALGRARITRSIEGAAIHTQRVSYDELDAFPHGLAGATAEIDARGEVQSGADGVTRLASNETIALAATAGTISAFRSRSALMMTLASRTRVATEIPAYVPSTLRAAAGSNYDRRASLERRALGVTAETLHADVRSASLFPRTGSTQWIWRDAAYLELHPEATEPLLAGAAQLGTQGLATAFDIVVIAGTETGQEALVRALQRPEAESEPAFVVLVQRLSFLVKPRPSLVAFVARERVRHAGTDRGRAAAHTLGALARNVSVDEPQVAERIALDLVNDLRSAEAVADRVALLAALGNAGLSSAAPAVIAQAKDSELAIRRAVASALRRMEGGAVVDALFALVVDPAPEVVSVAVDSLLRKQLDDADWKQLAQLASTGRIPSEAHASLVNGLALRRDEGPAPGSVLGAMLASEHVSVEVKQQIEAALQD